MLYSVLVSIDVLIAASLIGLVLIQQGKGASAGAAFGGGGGASGSVFGARGSSSFLTRTTAILAALFFINSIVLAYLASNRPVTTSVMESVTQEQAIDAEQQNGDMETIKEEIKKQIEEAASKQEATLPEDVPGLNAEEVQDSVDKAADQVKQQAEQAEQVIDSANEEVQSLPADVPQN